MRIAICWTELTGYTTACWRALAAREGVELFVIAHPGGGSTYTFDAERLMEGIPSLVLEREQCTADRVRTALNEFRPDGVMFCGWFFKPYNAVALGPLAGDPKLATCVDNPWQGTLRQRLGRFVYHRFLSRMAMIMVANERSFQLARHLGFEEARIRRGMDSINDEAFEHCWDERQVAGAWPRRFLFVGQYIERKAVPELLQAYAAYRERVADPWPITFCGRGPLASLIAGAPGAEDRGFIQPPDLPAEMTRAGVFILPSHFETYGLVNVEAAAAGLPVITTEQCGSSIDVVRPYFNGVVCPTGNVRALTDAMRWMHDHYHRLPQIGANGRPLAKALGARVWAERWHNMFLDMIG